MAIQEKYLRLVQHLEGAAERGEQSLVLPIAEVDELVRGLPAAALTKKQWWSGSTSAQARAWRSAGWEVHVVGFGQQRVAFRRLASPQ